MTFKDLLRDSLDKRTAKTSGTNGPGMVFTGGRDAEIACNIVDHMFKYIDSCIKEDKSRIKLNALTKSFVRGLLNSKVKGGMTDFIMNMYEEEVTKLVDDIQRELDQRYK